MASCGAVRAVRACVGAEHELELVVTALERAEAIGLLLADVEEASEVIGVGPGGLRGHQPRGATSVASTVRTMMASPGHRS